MHYLTSGSRKSKSAVRILLKVTVVPLVKLTPVVYFTRKRGAKALGWHDIIMMQTMRRPQLLPCGHIGDKSSLMKFAQCRFKIEIKIVSYALSFDRTPFRQEQLLSIDPTLSYLCKGTRLIFLTTS